jgi:hypothetical protein
VVFYWRFWLFRNAVTAILLHLEYHSIGGFMEYKSYDLETLLSEIDRLKALQQHFADAYASKIGEMSQYEEIEFYQNFQKAGILIGKYERQLLKVRG